MARRADPMDSITKDIHRDVKIYLDNRDIKWTDINEWSSGPIEPSTADEVVFQFPNGKNWRFAGISVCVDKKFDKRQPQLSHSYLRHFLMGFAHANSAPPRFGLKDVELTSEYVISQLNVDQVESQMMEFSGLDEENFWYQLGRKADEGYTLLDENDVKMLCYQFLEETL